MSVDNAGVKEKVRAGLEEPSDAEVQGVIQALVGTEGGSGDIWPAIIQIRSWYRDPAVKNWRAVSARVPDLMAALLFHAAPGGPEVSRDAWLALKEMNEQGVSAEVLDLPQLPSKTHLAWLTEVIRVMQKDPAYWQMTSFAMTALVRGALHQTRLAADSDPPLRGTEDEVVRELTARTIESAIFQPGLGPEDLQKLNSILSGLRPDVAVQIMPLLKGASSGLEEPERMTALEFGQKYNRVNLNQATSPEVEQWLGRSDVQATVLELPHIVYIYVQGVDLYWGVIRGLETSLERYRPKIFMPILQVPEKPTDWNSPGVILKKSGSMVQRNPKQLPVLDVSLNTIGEVTPVELLAMAFQGLLGVPVPEYLGALKFTDAEDRVKLALFY